MNIYEQVFMKTDMFFSSVLKNTQMLKKGRFVKKVSNKKTANQKSKKRRGPSQVIMLQLHFPHLHVVSEGGIFKNLNFGWSFQK